MSAPVKQLLEIVSHKTLAGYDRVVRDGSIIHTTDRSGKISWLTVEEAEEIVRQLSEAINSKQEEQ